MKRSGWIIAVVALVVGLLAGYMVGPKATSTKNANNVKSVASEYITALTKGDVDKSYSLSSSVYQGRNTKEDVEQIAVGVKSDSATLSDVEVYFDSGSNTKAIYLATANNLPKNALGRTTGNFVIRMVQENGIWKIDSSQVY